MTLRFRSEVSTVETEYGTVILDQRSGYYFQLNPPGSTVVRMLLDGAGEDEAVAALLETYDVERERAARDVRELVDQLRVSGLVTA